LIEDFVEPKQAKLETKQQNVAPKQVFVAPEARIC
jgi:hypothetical protein